MSELTLAAIGREATRQLRDHWLALMMISSLVGTMGLTLMAVYYKTNVNPHHIVADSAEIAFLPEYTGAFTSIGVLAVWTAGILCVLSAWLLKRLDIHRAETGFLKTFGLLVCLLAIDDLFMLHEWMGLEIARFTGAADVHMARARWEGLAFAILGILWLLWLTRYWRALLQTEFVLVALAFTALGTSLSLDLVFYVFPAWEPNTGKERLVFAVIEELMKLMGIFLLVAYAVNRALATVRMIERRLTLQVSADVATN